MSTTDTLHPVAVKDDVVVTEAVLDAAPAKVWRALTRPEIVADWLGAAGFEPRPGSCFAIPREADRSAIRCEVLAADPPYRLSYTWREEVDGNRASGRDSVVTFELSPMGPDRTRLRIVHRIAALASRHRHLVAPRSISRTMAVARHREAPLRLAA